MKHSITEWTWLTFLLLGLREGQSLELSERFNVVCRIETNPVVFSSLAPTLLVLILKLLKFIACNVKRL